MCGAITARDGAKECDVEYIGYVIKEGIIYYQYKCKVCGEVKEVRY